ncbi:hypothetical protein ABT294_41405 [Nonomuraea sp. NPDC000554]|uniref:hypothetical protein n=1 Tax=Nonomuraea sp. NPDC000554 TaxID=3154259 RepID=UPI00333443BF
MDPDLYLLIERDRARELRGRASEWRRARRLTASRPPAVRTLQRTVTQMPAVRALRRRLGWVLVETGLRLVHSLD